MLIKNNNQDIIKRLAKDSYQKNRSRNMISIIAITAAIVLIFSLFTISIAQIKTKYIELAREMGNEISITLEEASDTQYKKAKKLDYLDAVGKEYTLFDGYINDRLLYKGKVVDEQGFKDMYASLFTNIHGSYPQKENDVMLSTKMLSLLDFKAEIGEEITLHIALANDTQVQQKTFILCGYYDEYATFPEYYDIFFSSAIHSSYPTQPMRIIMKQNDRLSQKEIEKKLYQDITMHNDIQKFKVQDTISYQVVESIYGNYDTLIVLIGIIVLSVYLLINNISQIALEKSIQEFGLLRTIGTTKKQLYAIQRLQFYKISFIALSLGVLLSIVTITTILPIFLKGMITKSNIAIDQVLQFNIPMFLILSACVLLITFFSMMLPIRKVCKISSKDALYFTIGKQTMRKKEIHRKKPLSMYAMAWRNITSNKAKLCKVLFSLFLSSILCLSCVIMIQFMDNRYLFINNPDFEFSEVDMQDDTVFLNKAFIDQTKQIKGIQSFKYSYQAFAQFDMSEEVWKPLMKSGKKKTEGMSNGGFQIVKDHEIEKLTAFLKHEHIDFDAKAFKEGNSVFNLHRHVFSKKMLAQAEQVIGNTLSVYNKQGEKVVSYQFQGYLDYMDKNFPSFENMSTNTNYKPYILISEKGFEKTSITKTISSYSLYVNQQGVEQIDQQLQTLINKRTIEENFPTRPAVFYRAKYKEVKEAEDYITSMQMLYYSICFIFMAMAVLNFFNVMYTSLLNRKKEFKTLEHIGMTHTQLRNLLLCEGLQYCGLVIVLLLLPGTLVLYYINQFIQAQRIEITFQYPSEMAILLIFINIAISIFLSLFIYHKVKKPS